MALRGEKTIHVRGDIRDKLAEMADSEKSSIRVVAERLLRPILKLPPDEPYVRDDSIAEGIPVLEEGEAWGVPVPEEGEGEVVAMAEAVALALAEPGPGSGAKPKTKGRKKEGEKK